MEENYREVILSDGKPCRVRVLGLFEARDIPVDWDIPFTYQITNYTGRTYEVVFPYHEYATPPSKPSVPRHEATDGSKAYHDWREYDLYQAAKAHYEDMDRRVRLYLERMTARIMTECISAADGRRITTVIDLDRVREAAMTRPVTRDALKSVLKNHFNASFDGGDLIDQLFDAGDAEGGGARYAAIASWEVELMNRLGMSQEEYSRLTVEDRALRICGEKLHTWSEALETRKMRQTWQRSSEPGQTPLTI